MKRWLLVLIPALALVSLISWRISQKRVETASQEQQRQSRGKAAALVQAATATRRDIVQTYEAVGSVEAPDVVNLTPQVTGRLVYLVVRGGDRVTAGQVLARIDPAEVEANVRNKEAALAGAQQRLAQAQVTQNAQNVGVGTDIRKQQAALASARATQAQAVADENAQIAAAQAAVTQAQGQVDAAKATIGNADAGIKSAQANLANARTNLERQQSLYDQGATAKQDLDNAQTQADVMQAVVEQAQQQRQNAVAALQSATAAKQSAQSNVEIIRNKERVDIAAAQAGVRQAVATLQASQANTANIPAYQRNIDALQAAVAAAEADLHAAEVQRGYTEVHSPLTGVVTQRFLDPGNLATPSQPLLTLQAVQWVWIVVGVPEEVSRHLYVNQTASCDFDGLPGQTLPGRITQINAAADVQSRQFTVRVRLENPAFHIKPGMFGHVHLDTDRVRDAVTVPREAVKFAGGDRSADTDSPQTAAATVTVIGADDKAVVRKVQTGASDNKYIAVTSGVDAGEKVVTVSNRPIKDGQPLRLADANKSGGGGKSRGGYGDNAMGAASSTPPGGSTQGGSAR